jgi:hypothetical protein
VGQKWNATGSFYLVGDPVPVADALQGDGSALREAFQEGLDGAPLVINPGLVMQLPSFIQDGEL